MKEIKLSPKERELLEPFYESVVYQNALKRWLSRKGQSLAGNAAQDTRNFEEVMFIRGQMYFIRQFNKFLKNLNEESRKEQPTK